MKHLNACGGDPERARKKTDAVQQAEVTRVLFADCLAAAARQRSGMPDITSFGNPA